MKIANIYKISLLDNKEVTVLAYNINDAIYTLTRQVYDEETKTYKDSKYNESDITSVALKESDIICPDYL